MSKVDTSNKLRIVIIGGIASSLWRFRGKLISDLANMGHEVVCLAGEDDMPSEERIAALGASLKFYPLNRKGKNILQDLKTLLGISRILVDLKPDVMLTYTAKPVIWGGIAARIARVPNQYALITGLGQQFSKSDNTNLTTKLLVSLYRIATKKSNRVIFQNTDDSEMFRSLNIVNESTIGHVNGSGVDLNEYPQEPLPSEPFTVLMVSRLLVKKGVMEYFHACEAVKVKHPETRFLLIGMEDTSPAGLSKEELYALENSAALEYLGSSNDVASWLKKSHLFVLPSYYGEGVPRTILEALSTGRAVVTTDNVGCRDAIEHGKSGLIIPSRDSSALAKAMQRFIEDPDFLTDCGKHARLRAEKRYDVNLVNKMMISIMGISPMKNTTA